nr:hypothetical protein [Tanacetum cinerariifolium]
MVVGSYSSWSSEMIALNMRLYLILRSQLSTAIEGSSSNQKQIPGEPVHLAAVFEREAMEEAHWGAFSRRNSMELTERIRQRDDAIANIHFVGNHHNIQTAVAYLREIQLGDIGKLDSFRAMVVESDHRLRHKRWYITKVGNQ